ncbi:RnfABCDGE type electron transport complex subunit G [Pseudomonas capsici]|uniref:RnfABCDGE type electron transport complex subunit G n=1 Tax=Pseudomonas capsici TaxID=2810614 RepID=A0ABT3C0K4_9PSED|nr:RnfABCDGE type electron transport complex subunit G [Pseudomonas capsici]MBX8475880.1 RnfABCDGE type electron transport complex subunit G [Pseudomonas cichorii]MCV4269574.1 RnfABCDGE type electron transport complex subunit G [Pseudomonas capsici]MCV4279513.1 RnfABCDGE type electron transport complex subunit G [Pseudomonas capsici]MCV4333395.1 RnfABCDGE type electron transport complex subunit G [Pseudomonas capsici]MCV4378177.1 RnfABCDGE type electron transport complex subunit G [Pseudomonas
MKPLGLVVILAIAGVGLGLGMALQQAAKPRIQALQEEARAQEWSSVLAIGSYDNQPLRHPLRLPVNDTSVHAAFLASREGKPCAVIFHTQGQGYAGPVELLIGVSIEGRLLGIKVLEQHETPGMGARIVTEPQWLKGFSGKSLNDGAFDQIAGATITSRAVVGAIHNTLRYFDEHKALLVGSQP